MIFDVWPTKILVENLTNNINESLFAQAFANQAMLGELTSDNHCIWDWEFEEIDDLRNIFFDGFQKYLKDLEISEPITDLDFKHAWCQIDLNGSYVNPTHHQFTDLVAIYYVSNDELAQDVTFLDPRNIGKELIHNFKPVKIKAYPGRLVIFPGYLTYYNEPYISTLPRVSYACTFDFSLNRRDKIKE